MAARAVATIHQLFLFLRKLQRRHSKHFRLHDFDQLLSGLHVPETLQECPVVFVEMRLGLDQNGPRQMIEPNQGAVREVL